MCLLVNQPEGVVFESAWIDDFYTYNADGVGVMWAEDGVIHTVKHLPKDQNDLISFFRKYIDNKKCAWHLRMKTHGHIDLENCHPYLVLSKEDGYPIYLMHNGVLHTGNSADTTKSDTWHYIQDVIRPILKTNPTAFMEEWFKNLIEDHIGGSNKFIMMDALGNTVVFNEKAGVEWHECWLSNTYAWSAHLVSQFSYKNKFKYTPGYGRYDYEDDYWGTYPSYSKTTPAVISAGKSPSVANVVVGEVETEEADDDDKFLSKADDYAAEFFEVLNLMGMDYAYNELTFEQVRDFYLDHPTAALYYIDDLMDGYISEADVLERFNEAPLLQVGMA